ncbi:hypothetical protein J2X76_006288 [Neorhizobium sp. 2083]|uniref:hypothetical protein n=1 Tax=Neorhizobium sp. 2083 TaxID=2817762 RepID=UPI002865858A|nr:hypothetical protein [Neorhizobium sp. 2083]MDR6821088.1 hypothetical protein [Neorhizobium sp. 2083]
MLHADLRRRRMGKAAVAQHDNVRDSVIANVTFEIHTPFIRAACEKIPLPRPPKRHISKAQADMTDGSAFLFNGFSQQPEERRGRPLEKQERAGFHVTQPVGKTVGVGFGIDEASCVVERCRRYLSTNFAIETAFVRSESQPALVSA